MSLKITSPFSVRLGVVGAGTMGSGIALAALLADFYVILYDVTPEVLERAQTYINHHLTKKDRATDLPRLRLTQQLEDLSRCNFVIEAVPEDISLKQDLVSRLDMLCPPPAILATNTSTLAVTAIAAASTSPQRVAGMHFFNPAPVLPLVEVVRAAQTSVETLNSVTEVARLLGKTPVTVNDTPGFIVNRVARPFYGEALRLAGERSTTYEQIDSIVELGGGFRMGPFRLMDLIGIDVNLAAMKSMHEQTYGEPRYRPHPIQLRMVQQGTLGRKTGRGFYIYEHNSQPGDPDVARPAPPFRELVIFLPGEFAPGLEELCRTKGCQLLKGPSDWPSSEAPAVRAVGLIAAGAIRGLKAHLERLEQQLAPEALILCQCADCTLAELAMGMQHPERLVGFDGLFLAAGKVATLTAGARLIETARHQAEEFFSGLGRQPVWVDDTPGLVLPRIVCMLANEAAFAAGESVAEVEVIDQAMRLGAGYPLGPLEWAQRVGISQVVRVLDHLHTEYGEERYRVAPLLRRWARQAR